MLVDIETIKTWLKIPASTTAYDDVLTGLEERVAEWIHRELRWYFGPSRERVEVLNGTGTPKMFLLQPPVDGAVTLHTRSGPGDDYTVVADSDYELGGRGLYCAAGHCWAKGFRNFRATYNEGFEEVPGDIVQLVLDVIAVIWNQRGKEGFGSERIGDYNYSMLVVNDAIGNVPRWEKIKHNWRRGRI